MATLPHSLLLRTTELFPYPKFKPNQLRLIKFIHRNPRVLVHAPTGFGKTPIALAALLPFVRSEKNPDGSQLIVFTRTKTQIFERYLQEISRIVKDRKRYGYIRALPLIAKADYCIQNKKFPFYLHNACSVMQCPEYRRTRNNFDEDPEVIADQLPLGENIVDTTEFKTILQDFGCPYLVLKRLMNHVGIILTTHAYLQSPALREGLLPKLSTNPAPMALVDEAHNFTYHVAAQLTANDLDLALTKGGHFQIIKELKNLLNEKTGLIERPSNLEDQEELMVYLTKALVQNKAKANAVLYKIVHFLETDAKIWLNTGESLEILEPYPDEIFSFLTKNFSRVVAMSGSFEPLNTYVKYFTADNYTHLTLPSVFTKRIDCVFRHPKVTTQYKRRNVQSLDIISLLVKKLHAINEYGHTVVFATSHSLKNKLTRFLSTKWVEPNQGKFTWQQTVLPYLHHELILGVLSGRLSEGIEIIDPKTGQSKITMIIIVGLPYPVPNVRLQTLAKLYTKRYGRGRADDFLLTLPMQRSLLQAIGRGIRSENDYCASIILDYRAARRPFVRNARIFSKEESLFKALRVFYKNHVRIKSGEI